MAQTPMCEDLIATDRLSETSLCSLPIIYSIYFHHNYQHRYHTTTNTTISTTTTTNTATTSTITTTTTSPPPPPPPLPPPQRQPLGHRALGHVGHQAHRPLALVDQPAGAALIRLSAPRRHLRHAAPHQQTHVTSLSVHEKAW